MREVHLLLVCPIPSCEKLDNLQGVEGEVAGKGHGCDGLRITSTLVAMVEEVELTYGMVTNEWVDGLTSCRPANYGRTTR